ncbi:hypothetical protein [Fibrobacter succinogenes]|uniref:hypothetical protein n=1 Tax=Fibrobacter succinogenes TaxID=833 RepID=UPI00156843DA|nr:hypothetical protein [Fibrobacter succinogenes]
MNFLKNIIFIFLLTSSLLCSANAAQNHQVSSKVESKLDNIDFYKNSVANKTTAQPEEKGIVLGSELTVFGIMCLMSATASPTEAKDKSNKKSAESIGDAMGNAVEAGALTVMGVICTLIGLPILIYNGYKYSQAQQDQKQDEQKITLEKSKPQKQFAQFIPSL